MTESILAKNMKRWFWSFFLGQAVLFAVAGIWFSASIASVVSVHDTRIKELDERISTKADLTTVMRIKADSDRVNEMILEELRYIRERVDELNRSK